MGSEFELKYKATPEILSAVLATLPGQVQHFEMRTTYYDTVHRLLAGRHWTLRRRIENGVSICTFKTPGADGANMDYIWYGSPIGEARAYMDEVLATSPVVYPDASILTRGTSYGFLPEEVSRYVESLFMQVRNS